MSDFKNVGFCEEGHRIGNCITCGANGVLVDKHSCKEETTVPNLIYNAIRTPDGTVICSRYRHDYVTHRDKNGKMYMVDGGLAYLRRSNNGDEIDLSKYDDEPHHVQRLIIRWGTRGVNGDMPLCFISIADMGTAHIQAVLKECRPSRIYEYCMKKELLSRDNLVYTK